MSEGVDTLQIPAGRMAKELALWTGLVTLGVGFFKYLLFPQLLRRVIQNLAPPKHRGWFDRLTPREQTNMCGRLFDGFHHIGVSIICLLFAQNGDFEYLRVGLYLEFGIDLFDMVAARLGFSLNGYSGIGVTIHHIVAVLMVPCVVQIDFVPPALIGELLLNLDASGGIDILFATVLPKTPLFGSKLFLLLSTGQYLLWIWSRIIWFNVLAWELIGRAWGSAGWPVFALVLLMFALLTLFNVVVTLVRGKRVKLDWLDARARRLHPEEYTHSSERAIDVALTKNIVRLVRKEPMVSLVRAKRFGNSWLNKTRERRASQALLAQASAAAAAAAAEAAAAQASEASEASAAETSAENLGETREALLEPSSSQEPTVEIEEPEELREKLD